jgi:hypothetical protein
MIFVRDIFENSFADTKHVLKTDSQYVTFVAPTDWLQKLPDHR